MRFQGARALIESLHILGILVPSTLSGQLGEDAKPYQEKQVRRAIEEVQE